MPNVIVTLEAGNGASITLPQYAEVAYGNQNEVTFAWHTATANVLYQVMPAIAKNVQVERNRAGTYIAIIDPGVEPVRMEWTEYQFDGNRNLPRLMQEYGVLAMSGNAFRNLAEQTTLTLYRVHYVFVRGTGESYDLTGLVL